MEVFLLWLIYDDSSDKECKKLLGIYTSENAAQQARQRALDWLGFSDFPQSIQIAKRETDTDLWTLDVGQSELDGDALVRAMHKNAALMLPRYQKKNAAQNSRHIHCSELPESEPTDVLGREWNCYRREVGRLLKEGHEGKFVLIKDREIVGIHDTCDEARLVGMDRFSREPFLVKEILEQEPLLRGISY